MQAAADTVGAILPPRLHAQRRRALEERKAREPSTAARGARGAKVALRWSDGDEPPPRSGGDARGDASHGAGPSTAARLMGECGTFLGGCGGGRGGEDVVGGERGAAAVDAERQVGRDEPHALRHGI